MAEDHDDRPARVLLAEDDADIRDLVSMILEDFGYDMVTVGNADDALRECREQPPALALLDVSMPGDLDGLDVTRALRADAGTSGIPILLLTALAQQDDVTRGLAAGADGYVVKPFDPEELVRRIRELLPDRT